MGPEIWLVRRRFDLLTGPSVRMLSTGATSPSRIQQQPSSIDERKGYLHDDAAKKSLHRSGRREHHDDPERNVSIISGSMSSAFFGPITRGAPATEECSGRSWPRCTSALTLNVPLNGSFSQGVILWSTSFLAIFQSPTPTETDK